MMYSPPTSHRGFTLLIAIVLATVALVLGLSLADVAYKQVLLSTTQKQSETAFYAADSALECALYYDQQANAFDYQTPAPQSQLLCGNNASPSSDVTVTNYSSTQGGSNRITTFTIPCAAGGISATVTVYKTDPLSTAICNANGAKTCIYANGYNTCSNSDPNRFERGLKVLY